MAERLESEVREHRTLSADPAVRDAVTGFVLVVERPDVQEVIREASRLARNFSGDWHVLWLGKPGESREHRCRVAETLAFAESLGAVTAMTSGSFAAEVSAYVREHNLSMIAIADMGLLATMRRRHLLRHVALKITFVILSSNTEKPSIWDSLTSAFRTDADDVNYSGYVVSPFPTYFGRPLSWLMPWIQPTNFAMCYLLVSFLVAIRYGMRPAAFAVVLSIVLPDPMAVAPLGSFAVSDLQYLFTFFVMLTVGIVSARLVAKSETIARESREREAQMSLLYETARSLAGFMDRESLYREAHEVMTTRLDIALEIWEPDSTNGFIRMNHALANADPALMQLAVDHHRPTGCHCHRNGSDGNTFEHSAGGIHRRRHCCRCLPP